MNNQWQNLFYISGCKYSFFNSKDIRLYDLITVERQTDTAINSVSVKNPYYKGMRFFASLRMIKSIYVFLKFLCKLFLDG